jgi:methionyl-tRNA formyltransferase
MTLLFFGSSGFSVPALHALRSSISCVVTKKTKPRGRGYLLQENEVGRAAFSLGLPVREIGSFTDEEARGIADPVPDLLVVVSFGLIIPQWFLDIPRVGAINVHPSLLPKYRGPSPVQWVIWNGERETGITVIRMNERMDAGDILYQESIPLDPEEDGATLSRRLSLRVPEILPSIVEEVGNRGFGHGVPQEEREATYTPLITKEMGRIDWHRGAAEIVRRARAVVEWPTAYTFLEGKMLKVFKLGGLPHGNSQKADPGTIIACYPDGIEVAAGEGSLILEELQMENRKRMAASDFARGYRHIIGKRLA